MIAVSSNNVDPLGDWWKAYLKGVRPRSEIRRSLRTVELFSGAGGLAIGFRQACAELGLAFESVAAVDQDAAALEVYRANHATRDIVRDSVTTLVDYQVRGSRTSARFVYQPEIVRRGWDSLVGATDVLLAGPPCQGHSNLNNFTRRDDRRNELYLSVPAVAVALDVPVVIIENVQAVVHDRLGVVASTVALLEAAGYHVAAGTLHADRMGWPQRRSRYFLVARKDAIPTPLGEVAGFLRDEPRSALWAIEDLIGDEGSDFMTQPSESSDENSRRIDWLFDNGAYDLALSERPECHREGTRYMAVYGRLHPDQPAPTITTGFMSIGQGRNVHPTERRAITAREAARLQGFPDSYIFQPDGMPVPFRKSLSKWIGDAVPMPLGYAASIAALAPGWS